MSASRPSRLAWFLIGLFTALACVAAALTLVWVGAIVVPPFTGASHEARESALLADLQTVRAQLELYKVQHNEKGPHTDESGSTDTANFVARLTGRTDRNGRLDPGGPFGPYLPRFPSNPFAERSAAVVFGTQPPPGDGSSGWYFNTRTGEFSPNDPKHKDL